MDRLKALLRRDARVGALAARVTALEQEVQECRQVNLRLAELTDVVAELLVPLERRDQAAVDEVLRRFSASVEGHTA